MKQGALAQVRFPYPLQPSSLGSGCGAPGCCLGMTSGSLAGARTFVQELRGLLRPAGPEKAVLCVSVCASMEGGLARSRALGGAAETSQNQWGWLIWENVTSETPPRPLATCPTKIFPSLGPLKPCSTPLLAPTLLTGMSPVPCMDSTVSEAASRSSHQHMPSGSIASRCGQCSGQGCL